MKNVNKICKGKHIQATLFVSRPGNISGCFTSVMKNNDVHMSCSQTTQSYSFMFHKNINKKWDFLSTTYRTVASIKCTAPIAKKGTISNKLA